MRIRNEEAVCGNCVHWEKSDYGPMGVCRATPVQQQTHDHQYCGTHPDFYMMQCPSLMGCMEALGCVHAGLHVPENECYNPCSNPCKSGIVCIPAIKEDNND